ncbi:DUF4393 domain-containing protein [Flavobacterium sp. I-SCBP12n]|uniref:DUF4393 domain-containing protein n=1 Tax=Flavobacterium pygoscelis TaxID=2893176 RepID=A0A9X1XUC6_9FLAO|nr:Abi-alpha family protein [Flavobacterium pygoscelis]MCK8143387.1 DUF4393 domain-containing protein [Flavobacterium pygoscelis]
MENKEFNIKSSTVEKGLELAKEFLGKLISPTIEEVGLLMSDNIKFLRFKNQVRILLKAKEYVESKNLTLTEIPIKILVPLLEKASLENNESLQDKWAKMLVNMVNSEKNLQNQIFPYLLSQISIEEFNELKELIIKENNFAKRKLELTDLKVKLDDKYSFKKETKDFKAELDKVERNGFWLSLEGFEHENLLRLGLIKRLPPKIYIEEFKTGGNNDYESSEQWHQIEAEYDFDDFGYRISDLGLKFIETCEIEEEKASH